MAGNYVIELNTGNDTSKTFYQILAFSDRQDQLNANGYNSTTLYFHVAHFVAQSLLFATVAIPEFRKMSERGPFPKYCHKFGVF